MPVGGALRAPRGGRRTDRVLDLVQRVLYVGRQLVLRHDRAVQGVTRPTRPAAAARATSSAISSYSSSPSRPATSNPRRCCSDRGDPRSARSCSCHVKARGERVALQVVTARDAEVAGMQRGRASASDRSGGRSACCRRWAGTARRCRTRACSRSPRDRWWRSRTGWSATPGVAPGSVSVVVYFAQLPVTPAIVRRRAHLPGCRSPDRPSAGPCWPAVLAKNDT